MTGDKDPDEQIVVLSTSQMKKAVLEYVDRYRTTIGARGTEMVFMPHAGGMQGIVYLVVMEPTTR